MADDQIESLFTEVYDILDVLCQAGRLSTISLSDMKALAFIADLHDRLSALEKCAPRTFGEEVAPKWSPDDIVETTDPVFASHDVHEWDEETRMCRHCGTRRIIYDGCLPRILSCTEERVRNAR